MRDYLSEAQSWMHSPVPIREMLAKDYDLTLAAIGSRLKFEDMYVRKYAAYCLGQIGDLRMELYLQEALDAERVAGVRLAMSSALRTIQTMPAGSGATEAQRCQYMQEIYEGKMPENIRQKMLATRSSGSSKTGRSQRGSPTPAKASSGCLLIVVGVLLTFALSTVFLKKGTADLIRISGFALAHGIRPKR